MSKNKWKWLLYVMPLLIISSGSIGYAAIKGWNVNPQIEASFDFGADEVATFNQHFTIDNKVSATGFTEDGIITTTSVTIDHTIYTIPYVDTSDPLSDFTITILFSFDGGDSAMSHYAPDNATGFTLLTVLADENSNLNLFDVSDVTSSTLKYGDAKKSNGNYDNTIAGEISSENGTASSWLFDFSDNEYLSKNKVYFSVTFTLSFHTGLDYLSDFYSKLDADKSLKYSLYVGAIGWTIKQ